MIVCFHHYLKLFPESFERIKISAPSLYGILVWVSGQNKAAVLLFFVLSGFVISRAIADVDVTQRHSIMRYALRRAARILPLYWLSLGVSGAVGFLIGMDDPSYTFIALAGNLAFLQTSASDRGSWFPPFALNGPYWSLSYEVFYYSLAPLCLKAIGGAKNLKGRLGLVVLASYCLSLIAIAAGQIAPNPILSFLTLGHVWVSGFVIEMASETKEGTKLNVWIWSTVAFTCLIDLGLSYVGLSSSTLQLLLEGATVAAVFSTVIVYWRWFPFINAANAAISMFQRVGSGSYALYLMHYPLILWLRSAVSPAEAKTMEFIGCSVVGAGIGLCLVFPWIEAVASKNGRKLFLQKKVRTQFDHG